MAYAVNWKQMGLSLVKFLKYWMNWHVCGLCLGMISNQSWFTQFVCIKTTLLSATFYIFFNKNHHFLGPLLRGKTMFLHIFLQFRVNLGGVFDVFYKKSKMRCLAISHWKHYRKTRKYVIFRIFFWRIPRIVWAKKSRQDWFS